MNNPFTKIFGNISKLGASKEDTAIGVDIGSSAIKIVEIKKKAGKAVLETYGAIALGPYANLDAGCATNLPVPKLVEALKEVLKQSNVTGTSPAFAIPVQASLIFIIELPTTIKDSEIPSIVPNEARKYIPVPITEVSLDYFILPKKELSFEEMNAPADDANLGGPKIEKTNVLVVATQNEAIAKYRSIVSEAKFSPSFFEIEIFSSVRSNFEHELSPVLLMDFGASRTKLTIVEFGMVKEYHTVNRGGADISASIATSFNIPFSEAEKMKKEFGLYEAGADKKLVDIIRIHLDYIFSETNDVLLGYERQYNRTISKVIFSGGGSLLKGLTEVAANNFRAEVEIGRPFNKTSAPPFLEKVLINMGPEFAVAIGIALRKLQ